MIEATKTSLRRSYRKRRQALPELRRKAAALAATKALSSLAYSHSYVLSFASFGDELNLWPFNHLLEEEGKLLLPKVEGGSLRIFQVQDISQLIESSWGSLLEPDSTQCQEIDPAEVTLAVVPALVFDSHGSRIGYGSGYYDRFLATVNPSCQSIGVGFNEQLEEGVLPTDSDDYPLDRVLLF